MLTEGWRDLILLGESRNRPIETGAKMASFRGKWGDSRFFLPYLHEMKGNYLILIFYSTTDFEARVGLGRSKKLPPLLPSKARQGLREGLKE